MMLHGKARLARGPTGDVLTQGLLGENEGGPVRDLTLTLRSLPVLTLTFLVGERGT